MASYDIRRSVLETKDSFLFWGVCFYILSQSYTIPIFDIGLNWTLFIRFSDIALLCIALGVMITPSKNLNPFTVNLGNFLLLILTLTSFNILINYTRGVLESDALNYSYYAIYKMCTFYFVFIATNKVKWTDSRLKVVVNVVGMSSAIMIGGVFLVYYGWVDRNILFSFFNDGVYLGPWFGYLLAESALGGFSGYNHQLLILQLHVSLIYLCSMNFKNIKGVVGIEIIFVFTIFIGLITSSRSVTLGIIFFYVLYLWEVNKRKIHRIYVLFFILCILISPFFIEVFTTNLIGQAELERLTSLSHLDDPDTWSGRFNIWEQYFEKINSWDVVSLLLGTGIGSLKARNAHNNYLQVFLETGLLGLIIFSILIFKLLLHSSSEYKYTNGIKYGMMGILLNCMTQESLYPVPAFADNLGYLMVVLAIVFQTGYFREHQDLNQNKG